MLEKSALRDYINKWLAGFVLIAAAFLCVDFGTFFSGLIKIFNR